MHTKTALTRIKSTLRRPDELVRAKLFAIARLMGDSQVHWPEALERGVATIAEPPAMIDERGRDVVVRTPERRIRANSEERRAQLSVGCSRERLEGERDHRRTKCAARATYRARRASS